MASDETNATNTVIGIISGVFLLLILPCAVSCCLRGRGRRRIVVEDVEKGRLGGGRRPRPSGPSGCSGSERCVRFGGPDTQAPGGLNRIAEPPPIFTPPQLQPNSFNQGDREQLGGFVPVPRLPEQHRDRNPNGQTPVFVLGGSQGPSNQGGIAPCEPHRQQTTRNGDLPIWILEQIKVCPEHQQQIQAKLMQKDQDV